MSKTKQTIANTKEKMLSMLGDKDELEDTLRRSWMVSNSAEQNFGRLTTALDNLSTLQGILQVYANSSFRATEDHHLKYVIPCVASYEKLESKVDDLQAVFAGVGVGRGQVISAAKSYHAIVDSTDEAAEAAVAALEAALTAYSRADPAGTGQIPLGLQAENSRVHSEDLSQEAQGLKQNAVDMGYHLEKLRQRWRERRVLVRQYAREVDLIARKTDLLPAVSDYSRQAQFSASEAMAESDRVSRTAEEMSETIRRQIGQRVEEMKSFSSQGLPDIPRKREGLKKKIRKLTLKYAYANIHIFLVAQADKDREDLVKQTAYMKIRTKNVEDLSTSVSADLEKLRARVAQAKKAAAGIHISITNDWSLGSVGGRCSRAYRVPRLSSTLSNEVLLRNFSLREWQSISCCCCCCCCCSCCCCSCSCSCCCCCCSGNPVKYFY